MSEIITGTTPTEEPVSGQAPAADSSPVFLPKDHLAQGYYGVTDSGAKFLCHLEAIAAYMAVQKGGEA